jgi:mannose-1-phosphate guanylyltransferase
LIARASQIPAENFILEPQPRGTAAVIGLAAAILVKRDPRAVMLVLPSDHFIRDSALFQRVMRIAVQVANQGFLVTLGIKPTFPSSAYGYIQQGSALEKNNDHQVFQVLKFTEKPDTIKASQMLASGDHSWNSGMFIWCVDRILNEITRLLPELASALDKIGATWSSPEQESMLVTEWMKLDPVSIDYGVMEKAENVAVLPAGGLGWSDVGSWESLFDVLSQDEFGNVVIDSDHLPLETRNSLVYSSGKKLIVTIGVDDLIVVDSGDALLICHRDQTQQVRKVIENLAKTKRERYL